MGEIRLPYGLCDITYDGKTYSNLADEAEFQVIPKYQKLKIGNGLGEFKYLLEDYYVSLSVVLTEENYETLKLANPSLQNYGGGFYDDPTRVNGEGKPLIIHPSNVDESIKDYDITIFRAVIDPESPYNRIFSKGIDKVRVNFIGKPYITLGNSKFKSYFFIGDTQKAGVY
jgi:hypothetical protein